MTEEQFQALLAYIEAAIDAALDDENSADEGLISAIVKSEKASYLHRVLVEESE